MTKNSFKYVLKYEDKGIVLTDYQNDELITPDKLNDLVKSILNSEIKNFINYQDNNLIIVFRGGSLVLKDYKRFFKLNKFKAIKDKYDMSTKRNAKVIKHKGNGKVIVLTSAMIISLLTGAILNKSNNKVSNDKGFNIEKITDDDLAKIQVNKSNKINNDKDNLKSNAQVVNVSYVDNTNSDKLINAENNYSEIINKYAQKYGLDANLILAMCTQERGQHSSAVDTGGGLGLMQIQVSQHPDGSTIKTTTFDNNNKPHNSEFTFYEDDYKYLDGNVKAGCALLRSYLNEFDGNIIAALYAYNAGNTNVRNAIREYANNNNESYKNVLSEINNYDWNKYIGYDDNDYLSLVMQYYLDNSIKYFAIDDNNAVNYVICNINNVLVNNDKTR